MSDLMLIMLGAVLTVFVLEMLLVVWIIRRGLPRMTDRIVDKLWDRLLLTDSLVRHEVSQRGAVLQEVEQTIAFVDVEGPQERPEAEGPDKEAQDVGEALTEPLRPRFGKPVERFYYQGDYEQPLRCSIPNGSCGGRPLTNGEVFYEIPDPTDEEGRFLVVCIEDRFLANPEQEANY